MICVMGGIELLQPGCTTGSACSALVILPEVLPEENVFRNDDGGQEVLETIWHVQTSARTHGSLMQVGVLLDTGDTLHESVLEVGMPGQGDNFAGYNLAVSLKMQRFGTVQRPGHPRLKKHRRETLTLRSIPTVATCVVLLEAPASQGTLW